MTQTYREQLYARVLKKVQKEDPNACWPWPGKLNAQGYGKVWDKEAPGLESLAHRVAYEALHGPTTECVLHACNNPPCCNPGHLHAGTRTENARERDQQKRHQHGEQHYAAVLTDAQVLELRSLHSTGTSIPALATKFNIKYRHAWKIVRQQIRRAR